MIREFISNRKNEIIENKVPGFYSNRWYSFLHHILGIFGIFSIAFGTYLTILYANLFSMTIPYSNQSEISFTVERDLSSPVYLYIEIGNFFQNHLLYSKSISYKQLRGENIQELDECKPLDTENGKIIYPCGLVANTYFQDQFTLRRDGETVVINTDDINFSSQNDKFRSTDYSPDEITKPPLWSNLNLEIYRDERFLNWINKSSFSPFRKLYGWIDGLASGEYVLEIDNNFPYGRKAIYLAESSWLGLKNIFLGVFMIITGILSLILYFYYRFLFK